jgi:hypothetical protein
LLLNFLEAPSLAWYDAIFSDYWVIEQK